MSLPVNEKLGRLARQQAQLDVLLRPRSVAVIGATDRPGSVGRTLLENLSAASFAGKIYPVNAKHSEVLGFPAFQSIKALPARPDLAVIVTPAHTVPELIGECAAAGVPGAVVISAGFREAGEEGRVLEQQILERKGSMRVVGPNCLGVMCPSSGLNATFAHGMALPGNVAFISQSGALLTAILDYSFEEKIGFSAFVSMGSMLDVGWADMIDYLAEDPHTKSIMIYMESIGDARAFVSAAREAALAKPILVIKAGRSEAAAKAAASHTGALSGSDEVLDAAFRRCGVLRVDSIADLFYLAEVLGRQPRPSGPRMSIVTNAGGPAVLAADALVSGGGQLAKLTEPTIAALDELLPPHWSHNNPVDVLGDADADRYGKAVEIVAKDPASDGLLVILTPQGMTAPAQVAERVKSAARPGNKPILSSFMGGADVALGNDILNRAGIPTFRFPDTAARVFNYMAQFSENLKLLYETPVSVGDDVPSLPAAAAAILESARAAGRTLLTEFESKQLLASYGIPTVRTEVARSEAEAVQLAVTIGYPAVLKLHSETVTHKSDVGGVHLNLKNEDDVRAAWRAMAGTTGFDGVTVQPMAKLDGYELILGASVDPQFGPVLLFGSGGKLVEVYRDRALALPPLNSTLALRLMERTRIFKALLGVRGKGPVDMRALEGLLVRFSRLVVEQRWIREIDINPLLVSESGLLALDARVLLYPPDTAAQALPRVAIRPYPARYIFNAALRDGTPVTVRPIRPEDEPLIAQFHTTLSDESVYFRYFHYMNLNQRVSHERLTRICFNDYDRQMALVAIAENEILGVVRFTRLRATKCAEFAMVVSDRCKRRGLGELLLRQAVDVARREGLEALTGDILPDNRPMINLARKVGFSAEEKLDEGTVKVYLPLT